MICNRWVHNNPITQYVVISGRWKWKQMKGPLQTVVLFFLACRPRQLSSMPVKTLERALSIALKAGLRYVYVGLPGHRAANTHCQRCNTVVIERAGFDILGNPGSSLVTGSWRCDELQAIFPLRNRQDPVES